MEEFAKQSGSHHAQALSPILKSPIAEKLIGHVVQERDGLRFKYSPDPMGVRVDVEVAGQSASALLEWAFGAGVRGITPVGLISSQFFEHRISWYTAGDRAGLTMGHKAKAPADMISALGPKQPPEVIAECFGCHATNSKDKIRPGIECERCHGPGAAHLKSPSASNIQSLHNRSQQEITRTCGECHRLPPSQVDERESVRFAPIGLMASRCFQQSELSCLTCHDPHGNVNQDASYYIAKCRSCHANATQSVNCRRATGEDCQPCHMPKTNIAPYLAFTDHHIRVSHLLASQRYEVLRDPSRAVSEAQAEIAANPKSLAGYLQLGQIFLEYNTPQPAIEIYLKALTLAPDSLFAHLGEGLALKASQRFDEAERELSLCFRRDPGMVVAFDALASLYLEVKDNVKLAAIAQQYLGKNPSDYRGYYYLAAAKEHNNEDRQEAEVLLRKSIQLNTNFAASFALLGKLLLQDGRAKEAASELEQAVRLRADYTPAHLYLANTYRKLGREADSQKEFAIVRDLNEKQRNQPALRFHQGGPAAPPR